MKLTKGNIYIALFAILYVTVAIVSTIHAVSFFSLANAAWLGIMLACAFEVGQAAVLFSILTFNKDRTRVMPWFLMCILTLVQILGNVFSSYKHLIINSTADLRFFKEPIFIWFSNSLSDDMTTVIVSYIVGAILPIVALALTAMVANYLSDREAEKVAEQGDESEGDNMSPEDDTKAAILKTLSEYNGLNEETEQAEDTTEEKPTEEHSPVLQETPQETGKENDKSHFLNL